MGAVRRCTVVVKFGMISNGRGLANAMRAICDRPKGHPGGTHKGRLVIVDDVIGIIEWPDEYLKVAPQ